MLRDFKVIDKPNPALFSTEVPEGYTLVDERGPRPPVPLTQDVIDFLCQPLPVPDGAKVVFLSNRKDEQWERPLLGIGSHGPEKGTVVWRQQIALDVTDMTPKAISAISGIYVKHFWQLKLGMNFGFTGYQTLWKSRADLFVTTPDPSAFWTWNHCEYSRGDYADMDVDVEVMDFDQVPPGIEQYRRKPVKNLTDPVQGQRVAWIRIDFVARNLQGAGTWPETEDASNHTPSTQPAETPNN